MTVLLADPNEQRGREARDLFPCDVDVAGGAATALRLLAVNRYAAVLARFPLEDWTPEEFLLEAQRVAGTTLVIIEQHGIALDQAVRLIKLGAFDLIGEETAADALRELLSVALETVRARELACLGGALLDEPWRNGMIGAAPAMNQVADLIRLAGPRKCTVLITGETGTGKEVAARALHLASPRAHMPMVSVNCGALPENLLEAELFGHVKGAFTGAIQSRTGRFEQAHRGTIFLDEIGEMPFELQSKLLRVLQAREFQRLGSSETVRVDVRVIAATNANLLEQVRAGRFREDLYYRLNVVPLPMPPLRMRVNDIPRLVHHFVHKICDQEGLSPKHVSPETMSRLTGYDWPGNVRELENAVEMAVVLSGDRAALYCGDFPLPSVIPRKAPSACVTPPLLSVPETGLDFESMIGSIERTLLEDALRKSQGNKKRAAEMLGLKRTTLAAKLKSLAVVA